MSVEVGPSLQPIISENIIQVENTAKVDKALNEGDPKMINNILEQETTTMSEDHTNHEEKGELTQKNEEKLLVMEQPIISKVDEKAIIIIEEAESDDDVKGSFKENKGLENEGNPQNNNINFEKIKNNNNQIKAKPKKISKREASTTTKIPNLDQCSNLIVPDLSMQTAYQMNFPVYYPLPITATPQQFLSAYDYSHETSKHFAQNLNNYARNNALQVQMLLHGQMMANMLNGILNYQNVTNTILNGNRQLNQIRSNELIIIDDTETQKQGKQVQKETKVVKPAKDETKAAPVKVVKTKSRVKRKQIQKAIAKAELSDDNSEDSPQSGSEQNSKEIDQNSNQVEVIRKRRKYNRTGIIKPIQSEQNRVYEDYVFNIHFEDKAKEGIVETNVGLNFQAQIPSFELDEEESTRPKRKIKVLWNPEEYSKEKIKAYFKMLKDNVECDTIHQERALKLYRKFDMDSNKLLEHIKKNPLYYKNYFEVRSYQSILRQRNNTH